MKGQVLNRFKHQQEALDMAKDRDYMGLFWQVGTGKTRCAIEIVSEVYKKHKRPVRTLVLSPHVTLENWKNEFKKWAGSSEHVLCLTKSSTRIKEFDANFKSKSVIVVNYEALRNKEFFERLGIWGPECMVLDEAHRIKNPQAQTTKKVLLLSKGTLFRMALTGTPMTNSPLDLFTQALFLDGGRVFGNNFFVYRVKYMVDLNERMRGQRNYFPNWKPRKAAIPELTKGMKTLGTRVFKEEALDLPDLVKMVHSVELSSKQRKIYEEMKKHAIVKLDDARSSGVAVAPLAITQALRLQQISSGFVVDDKGKVIEIEKTPPKLKALKEFVENYVEQGEKVIIWVSFKQDVKKINQTLKALNPAIIDGSTKDKQKEIKDFCGTGTDVLIANRKAGGIGINLVESRVSIVYSRNHSYEDEIQSEGRNYRSGSERHTSVLKIDLVAKDTIDEHILRALKTKGDMDQAIMGALNE